MRTTVTLDKDVEKMLRELMHRTHKGFKQALNDALRLALSGKSPTQQREPFVVHPHPMGLRAGIDPAGLNKLVDDLEAEESLGNAGLPRS